MEIIKLIREWFGLHNDILPRGQLQLPLLKFSIIVPSRDRLTLLVRLLESIKNKTDDLSNVEVLFMLDDDDNASLNIINEYRFYNPEVQTITDTQPRNIFNNENYINKGARLAKGKYLWTLGNDCEIVTKGWDTIVANRIEEFLIDKKDRICYTSITDSMPYLPRVPRGCCFPIITREVVECCNAFMPKEIVSYGADHWLWQNFRKIPRYNRILDLRNEISINHYSVHTSLSKKDEIYEKMYKEKRKDFLTQGEETYYINSLLRYIEEKCQ